MHGTTMQTIRGMFLSAALIVLAALFLALLIEGIKTHFAGDSMLATFFYLLAITALSAAIWSYKRSLTILTKARYE